MTGLLVLGPVEVHADDGRVLVGAVNQDALISAASNPAAALK